MLAGPGHLLLFARFVVWCIGFPMVNSMLLSKERQETWLPESGRARPKFGLGHLAQCLSEPHFLLRTVALLQGQLEAQVWS